MLQAFKTEINPTEEQKQVINRTIGTCRYVYNFFLAHNKTLYENGQKFMGGMDFSKWLNNEFIQLNPDKSWIKKVSTKSVKQSILNAHNAFMRFFNKQGKFPRFKKKSRSDVKMYFVKNDAKHSIHCERHRIKIPTLGWVQIKEKGYLPTKLTIKSGSVSIKAGRYYISVLVDVPSMNEPNIHTNEGIGVDLGLKDFAVVSNGTAEKNINKTNTVKKSEKKLKREQRKLSRKYESLKKRNKKEEGRATRLDAEASSLHSKRPAQNIQKQVVKVQSVHQRLDNIRTNHINQAIVVLVKTKPSYIAIEDLNVSGMMKNRHLARAVASQKFYEFRIKLENKCRQQGIEVRIVDRYYPSSKLCHKCGEKNRSLKLSDRVFICKCGYAADRDYNASLNLRDAKIYKMA